MQVELVHLLLIDLFYNIISRLTYGFGLQKMALQTGGMNLPGVGMPVVASADTSTKVLCLSEVPYIALSFFFYLFICWFATFDFYHYYYPAFEE